MIELELDFSEEDVEFANREELQDLLDKIDSILLSNKLIGKYAWIMVFTIGNPQK